MLMDVDVPIDKLEMWCLKLKVGTGTELEDNTPHRADINMFPLCDIIAGPLIVTPTKGLYFNVTNYQIIYDFFFKVTDIDRELYVSKFMSE